eukprot:gene4442-7817_t
MPALHKKTLAKNLIKNWRILRGDLVQVMTGTDKGKQGVVTGVFRKKNRLVVEGVNLIKKHVKKTAETPGQVITKEAPIHYSNVLLVCPETSKPTKIGMKFLEDGTKVRVSKASGAIIPKSDILKTRKNPAPTNSTKDTPPSSVTKTTFNHDEIIHKKNRILKKLEIQYYNQLKQIFERDEKKEKYKKLKQMKFEFEVFKRAKELLLIEKEEKIQKEEIEKNIEVSKKISNQIQEMK